MQGAQLITRIVILSALSVLLASCTAIKLGYENLPRLVQWQADRYLSLDSSQESLVNRHAKSLQRWHRQNLLPVYADFLHRVEEELLNPVSADQVAEWRRTVVAGWPPIAEQAAPAVAELAVTLRPAQLTHLREAIAKANDKSAREYRPADPVKRREARYRRLVDRAESLLGDTSDAQRRLMRESAAAQAVGEDTWWRARLARQEALLALLDNLATEKPEPLEATHRARTVLAGLFADQSRAGATPGDELTAAVLALATPAQRRLAVSRLDEYRQDFRLLATR